MEMERDLIVKSKTFREKLREKEGGSFFCFKVLPYTVFSLVAGLIFRNMFYFYEGWGCNMNVGDLKLVTIWG